MKLIKDGITLGDISDYSEDPTFYPKEVHFDCRPPIQDVDGLFDLLLLNGDVEAISILEQIADGVVGHVVAREVVKNDEKVT